MTLRVLPNPIMIPPLPSVLVSPANPTVNDDSDVVGFTIDIPATGTWTDIAFPTGAITTGENAVPVRIETLGTNGLPSGTLYATGSSGTVDIAATDDNVIKSVSINSGTGVSCTLGDKVAIRASRNGSGTLNGVLFRYLSASSGLPHFVDYNITSAGAWSKTTGMPMVMVKINGAWMCPPGCLPYSGNQTGEAGASPTEKGGKWRYPVSVRAIGMTAVINTAADSTAKLSLHSDPEGTPALVAATPVIDTDSNQAQGAYRYVSGLFTAPCTLAANTDYGPVVSPQETENVTTSYYPVDATYAAANLGCIWLARADGSSAFTPNTARLAAVSLIIDAIDDGGGAGDFPDPSNVTTDDTTNGVTGTLTLPAVGDVQSGVQYGGGGTEYTGTFAVPAEADVELNVQYGAGGTEFTGTLVVSGGGSSPRFGDRTGGK